MTDFAAIMPAVAAELLGEPNNAMSKPPRDVRYGTHGSLSVDLENGRFYDHENNIGGGVIDLVKLKVRTDHNGAVAWLRERGCLDATNTPTSAKPQQQKKEVAAYPYVDMFGTPLFEQVRFEPKSFAQRHRDSTGEWVWNIRGIERVLYRLPEVLNAVRDGKKIYICEGEKDCDNLREFGLIATTNPGGAGKWFASYNDDLKGADVVIIGDNDPAGRLHVEQVTRSLEGIAKSVCVIDLAAQWPECPDKGDISDFLDAGHDFAELKPTAPPPDDKWPEIDQAAFHGLAGTFVSIIEPHTEADPVAILVQFLTAFGNIIGNSAYYLVEGDKHHANLYALLVGSTSRGRKGTALGRVRVVFDKIEASWVANQIVSGLSSGEGVIEYARDKVEQWDTKKQEMEIVDPGVTDKRLMVIEAEFASMLAVMSRHGQRLSPVIRNAWDGHVLATLTKNPMKATGAHVAIIGHITINELRSELTRTNIANGFANRFLFVCVKRSKELPHGGHLSANAFDGLVQMIDGAVNSARSVGRVMMTDAAAIAWTAAYGNLSADRPGLHGAATARAEAQVIRLALIYALLDSQDSIDVRHLNAAMAVWAYCDESAALIFGNAIGNPVADEILSALARSPNGMTRTEISDYLGRNRASGEIQSALALLRKIRRADCQTQQTAGSKKPTERWFAIKGGRP